MRRRRARLDVLHALDREAIIEKIGTKAGDTLDEEQVRKDIVAIHKLGYFDEGYLAFFDCAVVRRGGVIVAFANLWSAGKAREMSVDLMRYGEGAPKGVIDYLLHAWLRLLAWR